MKKPVLYIIHGWTYTVAPWEQTIKMLEKQGFKVEMLHVPGLTTSSRKVWTIAEYVKWADRNLPAGAVALGHSNGGRILLNLCSQKPDKLSHLILLDAAGVYEASTKRDLSRSLSKKLGFLKKIPGLAKLWHKLTGATDYARAPENMKKTLTNMLDSDKELDLSTIHTPTSILWGEADAVTPPHQAEVMHHMIRGSTLKLFPGWTHAPYISHPDQLAKAIVQAYRRPPKKLSQEELSSTDAANVTAVSAALALKKAPAPTLPSIKDRDNVKPVAADVPTKLILRKDERITEGIVIPDADSAAVKYEAKVAEVASKTTDAKEVSASASLRRVSASRKPDTDVASASASASLRKTYRPTPVNDSTEKSASLALKRHQKSPSLKANGPEAEKLTTRKRPSSDDIRSELTEAVDFVPVGQLEGDFQPRTDLPGAITSGSIARPSRFGKVRRKIARPPKPARHTPASRSSKATSSKDAPKSNARPRQKGRR